MPTRADTPRAPKSARGIAPRCDPFARDHIVWALGLLGIPQDRARTLTRQVLEAAPAPSVIREQQC
jgi:hypothetical protein